METLLREGQELSHLAAKALADYLSASPQLGYWLARLQLEGNASSPSVSADGAWAPSAGALIPVYAAAH